MPGAAGAELRAAARALALGARTEDVLERLRARAGAPAWDTIVAAILLQRDAGGDLAGLLRAIAAGLEEAARVEADARSVTAQARFTAWLVALLPVGAAVLAELADPGYVVALLRAPLAPWLLGAAAVCQLVACAAHQPHRARGGRHGEARPRARRARARAVAGTVVTRALLLAVLAAVCAATGIVELAAAGVRTRPRRRAGAGARVPAALARLGRRTGVPAAPRDLARRLDAAGAPPTVTVAEVMALKGGAAVAAFAAALAVAALLPGRLGPVAIAVAPAGAFLAPDAWLARATRRRRAAMAAELPEVLDLLHVAVGAGLPALRALGEVGRRRGGPLATELRAAACRARPSASRTRRRSTGSRTAARCTTSPPWRRPSGAPSATAPRWRRRCTRSPPTPAPSARSACASARHGPRPRSSSWSRCCSCPR